MTTTSNTSPALFGRTGGHPNYRANQERAKVGGNNVGPEECCAYCGRATGLGKNFLYLTTLGQVSEAPADPETQSYDDLGLYPVGSDCAKLFKKAGVKLYSFDGKEK